jgi:hypothetical protein
VPDPEASLMAAAALALNVASFALAFGVPRLGRV